MQTPPSFYFNFSSPRGQNRLAWLIVILFIVFVSVVAQEKSLMADEAKHYKYGMNILNGDSDRFDDSKMPVSALNALPAKLASFLPKGLLKVYLEKIFVARFVTILFSALAACMVFHWSRKLYGFIPDRTFRIRRHRYSADRDDDILVLLALAIREQQKPERFLDFCNCAGIKSTGKVYGSVVVSAVVFGFIHSRFACASSSGS
jgi:hypothetical protein